MSVMKKKTPADGLLRWPRTWAVELFCLHRKFLVYNLVQRNLKLKYRQSILGWLWTVLIPAGSAVIYYLVFQYVMKVKIPNYLLFVMSGTLPWAFFSTVLLNGMESIVGNQPLVNKVPLPLSVFPYSEVITGFINLLFAVPVIVVISLVSGAPWGWQLLMIPICYFCLFFQSYGFSLMLATSFVFFRDLRHALAILLQMWFYVTPILYTSDMVPAEARGYLWLNPVCTIFEGLHTSTAFGHFLAPEKFCAMLIWTVVIFGSGSLYYLSRRTTLAEVI